MNSTAFEERLNRIEDEITQLRKILIQVGEKKGKSEKAWKSLMEASGDLSELWRGPSALQEIILQREK